VRITVTNKNDFELPDVWLALDAPTEYLDNKVAGLGALGAGASATTELELVPPDGISIRHHPIDVLVAAGDRPLAKERVVLDVTVPGRDRDRAHRRQRARVVLANKSAHAARSITVAVPGATRSFETLEPGAREELTLPLSASPKTIVIAQLGPWAQRRIEVPIPETRATFTPPEVVIDEHADGVGVRARTDAGLRDGWIAIDGQKQSYSDFAGAREGALEVTLGSGEHDLVTKVETASGLSVIDVRRLTRESVGVARR
jgi:hypothetical protein